MTTGKYSPAKTGDYPSDIPQFSKPHEKHLNNKHNSFHFSLKYAHMFILQHHLLLKTHTFPQATFPLLGTDNGQVSKHAFLHQM